MTPTVADPFKGHLANGDPRGPLSVAGGCVWPTVPAVRYWIISDDATIDLAFFNTDPVVLEFVSTPPAHNFGRWNLLGEHPYVSEATAVKFFSQGNAYYGWGFNITVDAISGAHLIFNLFRPVETCNRDIPLPNTWAVNPSHGVTGDTFRFEQIEWDQEAPPP